VAGSLASIRHFGGFFFSHRVVYDAGLPINVGVADVIAGGEWAWPASKRSQLHTI